MIAQASAPTNATSITPCPGVRAALASATSRRRTGGELASAWPVTRIMTICIENASRFQKPEPHIVVSCTGVFGVSPNASANVTIVSRIAKINGSGNTR